MTSVTTLSPHKTTFAKPSSPFIESFTEPDNGRGMREEKARLEVWHYQIQRHRETSNVHFFEKRATKRKRKCVRLLRSFSKTTTALAEQTNGTTRNLNPLLLKRNLTFQNFIKREMTLAAILKSLTRTRNAIGKQKNKLHTQLRSAEHSSCTTSVSSTKTEKFWFKPLYDCKNLRVIDVINWDYADTRPDQKKKRGGYTQKFYEEDRKTKTEKRGKIIKKKRSKPTKKWNYVTWTME